MAVLQCITPDNLSHSRISWSPGQNSYHFSICTCIELNTANLLYRMVSLEVQYSFLFRKKRVHTECGCNAHWQTSRQRKSWMSCENGQVPRCSQHWGLWLYEQSPETHIKLGYSQLNSVLLQTATACWNLATARISSQHTHCWATMCVLFQRMGSAQSGSWETHQLHLRGWWDEC